MMKNKYYAIILMLLFTAIWSVFWYMSVPSDTNVFKNRIPLDIGSWHGEDLPISKDTLEILETKNAIFRRYTSGGVSVTLWVVYAGENRKAIHPMEVCYKASGWDIGTRAPHLIEISHNGKYKKLPCVKLMAMSKKDKGLVLYFYKTGNRFTDSYYRQQLNVILEQAMLRQSESALFGITAEGKLADDPKAVLIIEDFIKELFQYISRGKKI